MPDAKVERRHREQALDLCCGDDWRARMNQDLYEHYLATGKTVLNGRMLIAAPEPVARALANAEQPPHSKVAHDREAIAEALNDEWGGLIWRDRADRADRGKQGHPIASKEQFYRLADLVLSLLAYAEQAGREEREKAVLAERAHSLAVIDHLYEGMLLDAASQGVPADGDDGLYGSELSTLRTIERALGYDRTAGVHVAGKEGERGNG